MVQLVSGKVLIITGAASGMGLAAAQLALAEGGKVLAVDISPCPSVLQGRPDIHFLQSNLGDSSVYKVIVEKCLELYGRIDALLNVAGIMDNNASADSVTNEMWDRIILINLTAPTRLIQAVLPTMRKQKSGSIVNVSSKAGLSGAVAGVAYTASKHGILGVTKNVAWRFKDENIRCNALMPGGVATSILKSVDTSTFDMEALAKMKPIHDAHNPESNHGLTKNMPVNVDDMAQALIFLSSDWSSRISGATIPVDMAWSTI